MTESHRLLAAPILGERGGGIGQVSELLWHTLRDEWGSRAELVTLLRNGHDRPGAGDKWRFGLQLAGRQVFERPEWILFSHLGLARVERFLPSRWGSPYAVFLHGIECWTPLPPADRAILKAATLRVANSHYTARRTLDANPDIGEIAVCPLALPASPAVATGARPSDAAPRVLVVGRLSAGERYKGHEQLLRAWPQVATRIPDARLVIVGEGDDLARLQSLASQLSPQAVEFRGFLPRAELDREYARASLFALPSRGEGFGIVYLEAMASGLACIASNQDAASEVIVDGHTGILVDPDDSESLGRALRALLENPSRAAAMGEAGRQRVLEMFTYERFRERMVALLREAFTPRPVARAV